MVSSTLVAVGGAITALLLALLFRIEDARERRFLEGPRRWLDRVVFSVGNRVYAAFVAFERGRMRLMIHYLVHLCLTAIRRLASSIASLVGHLEHRNRRSVRTLLQETTGDATSHLSLIKQHQKDTELSETEKSRLRDRRLAGE